MEEIADDVCPLATEAVCDISHRDIQGQQHNSEDNLCIGDHFVGEPDRRQEERHDGHGKVAGGETRLGHSDVEASASTFLARTEVVFAHSNTSFHACAVEKLMI